MPDFGEGELCKETAAASAEDHIGALPDALLLHTLSLLPADEAVRTCVLSHRWCHLWRYTPNLRLIHTERSRFRTADDFTLFANHLLCFRDRSPLFKCEIRLHPTGDSESYSHVDLWIKYALKCKLQVLEVICSSEIGLVLNKPLISRYLRTVYLEYLELSCSVDFSSCLVLEDLWICECFIYPQKISSKSLKHLHIIYCFFQCVHRLWISAPSLNSLQLDDFCGKTPLLESMPLLETALVRVDTLCDDYCFSTEPGNCDEESCEDCYGYPVGSCQCVLLNGLSEATYLELIALPIVHIYKRDLARCPIFGKLKTLLLNEWCVAVDLHALACILQHSPILEKLTLQLCSDKLLESTTGGEETFACPHLKVINIEFQEVCAKIEKVRELLMFFFTSDILPEQFSVSIMGDMVVLPTSQFREGAAVLRTCASAPSTVATRT